MARMAVRVDAEAIMPSELAQVPTATLTPGRSASLAYHVLSKLKVSARCSALPTTELVKALVVHPVCPIIVAKGFIAQEPIFRVSCQILKASAVHCLAKVSPAAMHLHLRSARTVMSALKISADHVVRLAKLVPMMRFVTAATVLQAPARSIGSALSET